MKKLVLVLALLTSAMFTFSAVQKEKPLPFEKLPKAAQEFIHTHFKGVKVVKCEVETPWTQFDVRMANGYDLEFDRAGGWTEIEKDRGGIENHLIQLLPQKAVSYIQSNYSSGKVEKIKQFMKGFKVSIETGSKEVDLVFGPMGELISEKLDR